MATRDRSRPIAFVIGPLRGRRAGSVQSIIFPRPAWTRAEAAAWLKRNRFKAAPLETLRGSHRASQRAAGEFSRLRTIQTSGHPHPVKNPRSLSPYTVEKLTRDPREQGFRDAQAGEPSEPPPWYTPTERGHYAEGYIAGGQGRKGRPTPPARLKKNPRVVRPTERELRQAVKLFQRFHGQEPKKIGMARVQLPRALMRVGPLPYLFYIAPWKGRETLFKHTFARHARPLLCASHDGRALFIVGGGYDFTRDGIVDRPKG